MPYMIIVLMQRFLMLLLGCLSRQVERWSKNNKNDSAYDESLRAIMKEKYAALLDYATAHSGFVFKVRNLQTRATEISLLPLHQCN